MTTIKFTLKLTSDTELGSGFGNENINDTLPRDHLGRPMISRRHLKGLLRDTFLRLSGYLKWNPAFAEALLGREGQEGDDGVLAQVQLVRLELDAPKDTERMVRSVTRTSLTGYGVPRANSLRTVESLATHTAFQGEIRLNPGPVAQDLAELAIRLSLLSLEGVGGGRTRGSGCCVVDIDNESRKPGKILKELNARMAGWKPADSRPAARTLPASQASTEVPVWMRLVFRAEGPVCCPESPLVSGHNVVRTGLGIPASAVLGAIITRLAGHSGELADRTMADPQSRFWPLLPSALSAMEPKPPLAVRVALSHRMSKLPLADLTYEFQDAAIEPYDWTQVHDRAPLKGGDGVLLRDEGGTVALWKQGDMPRLVTAHAVLNREEQTLYTAEAQAPMAFTGLVCLPVDAARIFADSLAKDAYFTFGKARGVQGGGRLEIQSTDCGPGNLFSGWHERVFVLQSPAAIPDDWALASAEEMLGRLVRESGWGELATPQARAGHLDVVTQAGCAVRFGWNRHGIGPGVNQTRRPKARRVFLPGTVFKLARAPENLEALLRRGLGVSEGGDVDGRTQGYGAVLPHPGKACVRYSTHGRVTELSPSGPAARLAFDWWSRQQNGGPSPSQIGAVMGKLLAGGASTALSYLKSQMERRQRIWGRWQAVLKPLSEALEKESPEVVRQALRTWQDLRIQDRSERETSHAG